MLACAGFGVWAVFSVLPALAGYGIREAWDTTPYWVIGLPILVVLHGLVGALTEGLAWRFPLWTVGGHALAMVLFGKSGADLGMLPLAVVLVGLPMYAILYIITLTGRIVARLTRST
jgi:hypothetical protein